MSEFLILTTTFAREPWLAVLAAFGLLVGFGALMLRLQDVLLGEPIGDRPRGRGVAGAARASI